ncbi:hypothetical protein [Pseudobutyrivibrio sp.]|uniref:hypothetical protein n=1 Tax=Pseudobutyrivibrio sp. TaxID=2014367 RepID=UPI0038633DD4
MDIVTYAMAQGYVKRSLDGLGALRGAPCTIKSITETDDGNIVTFEWTGDSGAKQTRTMLVKNGEDGISITDVDIDSSTNHLLITFSNGEILDAGEIKAQDKLTEPLTPTEDIGTIKGKTYPVGTKIEQVIRDMCIKYQPPAVTLTTTPATKLYDIVTDSISTILLKAVVTKKTKNVTKVSFSRDNVLLNEVTTGVADGGNFQYQYNPVTPINTDVVFKATATDGTQETNSSVTIKFVGRSYYGICDASVSDPDETVIKSGSNVLKDTKAYTYSGITTGWGKVFYTYPKSFGTLTSIRDEINNVNYYDSFQRSEVTVDGIDYYCYTLIEPTAATDNQLTFK